MKMLCRLLVISLLEVLLWMIAIHADTFTMATLLPRPITGVGKSVFYQSSENDFLPDETLKITEKDLNQSITFGNFVVNRMQRLETNLDWSGIHVKKGSPSHGQFIVSLPDEEALRQGREALIATKATLHLMNNFCTKYNLKPSDCSKVMSSYSLLSTPLEASCRKLRKSCNDEEIQSKYRSIDGSCNHKNDGSRGRSFTGYKRLLHPHYVDGIQEPRRAVNKKLLPSARYISMYLHKKPDKYDSELTLAVMLWTQFIEHDLSHTATSKMIHLESTIECCTPNGGNLSPRYIHPLCSPISIPHDDSYYSKLGLDCMTYVRSIPAFRSDCSFGPIDQINQATHYLDGSQIYGSTIQKSVNLRSYKNGQLLTSKKEKLEFLPLSKQPTTDCQEKSDNSLCFIAGDSRVNVHPQLSVLHTIWMREHNRIAKELKFLNPNWEDEILYQEARRIVIAEIQHITYNEWLPLILGKKYVSKIQKYSDYNDHMNPSVSNSFATAALRILNSLMDGKINLYKENREINSTLNIRDHFNKPNIIEQSGYLDAIVRGLATQLSRRLDFNFVEDINGYLFSNGIYGFDVFSLDIQRGRDHGLPPYTSYRVLCGLPEIKNFDDLGDVIPSNNLEALKKIYNDPNDIDLIVGGISEKIDGDSLLGPTFSCLIADQLLRTQRGDRYFYKNELQPIPFSFSQIREIEKTSLARIFCDNSNSIKYMQVKVFEKLSQSNPLISCDSQEVPSVNLKLWRNGREKYF